MLSDCGLLSQNLGNICLGNIFVRKSYQSSTNTTDLPETKQPVIAQNIALENRIFNISEFYLGTKYVISKQNSEYIYLSFKQRNHVFPNAFFFTFNSGGGAHKEIKNIYLYPSMHANSCLYLQIFHMNTFETASIWLSFRLCCIRDKGRDWFSRGKARTSTNNVREIARLSWGMR